MAKIASLSMNARWTMIAMIMGIIQNVDAFWIYATSVLFQGMMIMPESWPKVICIEMHAH